MTPKKLSANPNKTEYLQLNPNNVNPPLNTINLGSNIISPSDFVKNLCIIFQTDIFLDKHVAFIVKSYFLQLCDFRRIRLFTSKTAAITLVNICVHSRI